MSQEIQWTDLPSDLDKYPDRVGWYSGSILFRYEDDSMTMRIDGLPFAKYEELKDLAESSENGKLMIQIISLIEESDQVTQVGSKLEFDDIPERFDWGCPSCSDSTFQLRGKYTGIHAVCISCGQHLSVVTTECENCDQKSIFVKESASTDKWYQCYNCGSDLK